MKFRDWYTLTAKAGNDTAELSIFDVIGGGFFADEDAPTGKKIAAQLDALPDSIKTIRVRVNSPGGAVFDALHMANALRRQSAEKGRTVEMLIEGIAASAATIVTSAGDSIKIPKNAVMMVHMPSGVTVGPASAMRKTADALDRVADGVVATYRWVSQKSPDELRALMEKVTWMSAEEALANGFATEIIDAIPARAAFEAASVEAFGEIPEPYRSTVAALLTPPAEPAAATPADPAAVIRACKAAGCPERADDFLALPMETITAKLTEITDTRQAAEARATEIRQLCTMAKLPELAQDYIAGGMAATQIKAQLTVMTAKLASAEIDGRQPAIGTSGPRAVLNATEIYRQRNALPAGKGA